MLKVNRAEETTKPKYFTGGKPADFELVALNKAKIRGKLTSKGTAYHVAAGDSSFTHEFDAAALREAGEHFIELANIIDGKIKVAA